MTGVARVFYSLVHGGAATDSDSLLGDLAPGCGEELSGTTGGGRSAIGPSLPFAGPPNAVSSVSAILLSSANAFSVDRGALHCVHAGPANEFVHAPLPLLHWGLSATRPLSASSTYFPGHEVAFGLILERPELGGGRIGPRPDGRWIPWRTRPQALMAIAASSCCPPTLLGQFLWIPCHLRQHILWEIAFNCFHSSN